MKEVFEDHTFDSGPHTEEKQYKAIYFDLGMNQLKEHYSQSNPKGAYKKIQTFLLNHKFSHEQYSGYHSLYKTTDIKIFDLVENMSQELPWLSHCVTHFEVTDIGENHDLLDIFQSSDDDIDLLS